MAGQVTNVVFAGLGGQGVIKASDIMAEVAFQEGLAVKKSELHGMSQRGGSVTSDVRFGQEVFSPMVPDGQADYVVVLAPEELETSRRHLRSGGVLIPPDAVPADRLASSKCLNIALLGVLSAHLPFGVEAWMRVVRANLPEKLHEMNDQAFALGRESAKKA